MNTYMKRVFGIVLAAGLVVTATACDEFLDVTNPNVLEAENINPESDAQLLGESVWQQFISDFRYTGVHTGWYTASAWVGDTYPTRNEYGRRDVLWTTDDGGYWNNFGDNLYFARSTIKAIEDGGPSLALVRSYFVSGEVIRLMAEMWCVGTIADFSVDPPEARGPMEPAMLLDSAIADLQAAQSVAQQVTGDDAAAAQELSVAAQVHIARAYLQKGDLSAAAAAAAQVPADFVFELWHMDDSSNRALGNGVWSFSEARISLVVPPVFRAMADAGDPRISYVDMGRVAQDGVLTFYRQDKIKGWGDPERWASGLEARYIKIEADQNAAEMLAFINERRAVGNQDPLAATTDMAVLMTELLEQKTRDFWLESTQRWADFRRQPQYMSYIIPPGTDTYYKPELGVVENNSCLPMQRNECENNPNFEGTNWCIG